MAVGLFTLSGGVPGVDNLVGFGANLNVDSAVSLWINDFYARTRLVGIGTLLADFPLFECFPARAASTKTMKN